MNDKDQTTFSMIVAQILNEKREAAGMSLTDFLERIEMTQSSWSRLTRGLSFFSLEELRIACRALSLDFGTVIADADKVAALLPDTEDVEVIETTKASENQSLVPTIIAGAALAFLIARLLKK